MFRAKLYRKVIMSSYYGQCYPHKKEKKKTIKETKTKIKKNTKNVYYWRY